ncbi:PD-(D/E)XK nuclease family protein [uncultured Methylobacterium sp.]|uniref:PD-(D/E)XK nuclease family protein n=1 Tax=uncultured Methylobacterium sp. TaxID=157278 RepID=UPI0025925685|nr:PD-(D/E)XK nuclease family protein [uncultured Methylobacterium sp.]
MHIVFATTADGRAYPEHPGGEAGCVDGVVVGPAGLLDILATRLGLVGPQVPPVVRIATWQRKLTAAENDAPRFWTASLASDGWATARQLLSWRDALVEAGWSPTRLVDPPARLFDLAAAEQAGPVLPGGRAGLLCEVIAAIEGGGSVGVDLLECAEDLELLAPGWRRLVRTLEAAGTTVRPVATFTPVDVATDIGRLHVFLRTGEPTPLTGDGTVCELAATSATAAAECVAEWLACEIEAGAAGDTVVIVPDGDSGLLDQALSRRSLPKLGLSPASSFRGALQVLPLSFAVAWTPMDPAKLLELLLLPRPPMRRWAARTLAHALAKEPGVDGPAWRRAWERIEARLRDEAVEAADPKDTRKAEAGVDRTLATWRAWTSLGRYDRKAGMPAPDAIALCERVLDWAVELDGGGRDPLLLCVVGAARALVAALDALGHSPVTGLQIDRMIDQAIADGLPDPSCHPQEGRLRAVSDPGALWGTAHRVVWWSFAGSPPSSPRFPWSARERAALEAAGCCPERPHAASLRDTSHWRTAALNARSLLLVRSTLDRATEAASHPFGQQLHSLFGQASNAPSIRFAAERLFVEERVPLAAREVVRTAGAAVDLPRARPIWNLPPSLAARARDPERRESATSFEDLLACQMRWMLRHVAGLKAGGARDIPKPERLFGNLAHAVAQVAFRVGELPDAEVVRARAVAALGGLLPQIAAPLLLPGYARELAFARQRVPDALASLSAILARGRFVVEGLEVEHERDFGTLKVASRIDLVVRGPDGRQAVVDLKWTENGAGAHHDELAEGRAVQLATYSRLVEPDGAEAPAGYYLLRQQRLLAEEGSPLAHEEIAVSRRLADTWDAVARDSVRLSALAGSGRGIAAGVPGADGHLPEDLAIAPSPGACTYCDMTRLCRSASVG